TAVLAPPTASSAMPESDTKFVVLGVEIEFPKTGEGGHAEQFTMRQAQRETVFKRLEDEAAKSFQEVAAASAKRIRDNTPLPGSEAAVRKLIADLQAGKPDESMLARGGQQFLPQLQSQASQMGTVKSIRFMSVGPAGPDIYSVETEKGAWVCRIWLSA